MTTLKHVIIGAGAGVLNMHRGGLELATTEVVGVTDTNAEVGKQRAEALGCRFYDDYRRMLEAEQPDIAVILTPHPFHAAITIDCLRAGAHVLVEKPIAVHVAEADSMIRAAKETNRLLAVNFQQRLRPEIMAAKKLIDEGKLGKIQHVDIKITWTRTAAYYKMGGWRGTWAGEGGGVLMNQAPHELDLLCHLIGMPEKVIAWTRTIAHDIEVEDTVQAMLEWDHGAIGSVHISTAEAGQPQRFEIIATKGYLSINKGGLVFNQFETDLLDFLETSSNGFAAPGMQKSEVDLLESAGTHEYIYQNLHSAIQDGTPLIADGESARMGLELANAMTYSSRKESPVTLPLNREAYYTLLAELQAT